MSSGFSSLCGSPDHGLHRRQFLRLGAAAGLALGGIRVSGEAAAATELKLQNRRVLFLWLAGGSSQFETWDPKPGRSTGGPFSTISTAVPGVQVCELMPQLAARMDRLTVIRSLNTKITAHDVAADLISTGRPKEPALVYPEFGVVLAKALATRNSAVPDYVSVFRTSEGRRRAETGYLGAQHTPLHLERSLRPENLQLPSGLTSADQSQREELRELLTQNFERVRADADQIRGYNSAFQRVRGLMQCDSLFDIDREPTAIRERYGSTEFGQHCLLALRLLEGGVPMVKIARGFWDSHHDNFESHRELVPDFDHVFSVLLDDLAERGLMESTTIVVLSEFGRTPEINRDVGRDHYAAAWSCVLAGRGFAPGAVYGKTDVDGKTVADGEVSTGDLLATILKGVGLNPAHHEKVGVRPVPLAPEDAVPVSSILT